MVMKLFMGALVLLVLCASAQAGNAFRDCDACPLMVPIPAGTFSMGSGLEELSWAERLGEERDILEQERPQHKVTVNAFSMAATEVTRAQFEAFVNETGYQSGGSCWMWSKDAAAFVESRKIDWREPGFKQAGDHPVVCVNHRDAEAYARWVASKTGRAYRLPSEAEWEYAARAGRTEGRYWGWENGAACAYANIGDMTAAATLGWGSTDPRKVFSCSDAYAQTAPVAHFRPNAFGLFDVLGNVWEWVSDCSSNTYAGAPVDGGPLLKGDCSMHALRGGSWYNYPRSIRSAARNWEFTDKRRTTIGFRVARTN